jgi:hypothetical protein
LFDGVIQSIPRNLQVDRIIKYDVTLMSRAYKAQSGS